MNMEKSIKDVITTKLDEGIIERLVAENLEKGINRSLENLLGSYGDITQVIEGRIKEVMIKQLSSYDYSEYIVKLDYILTEILQRTALDNKKILHNFKELMVEPDLPKTIKVSDIFEKYKEYVAGNVDTSELEIDFDYEPSYQYVDVTMEVEYEEKRRWSSFEYAKIVFECKEDTNLNYEIKVSKFDSYPWSLSDKIDSSLDSLRYLNEFKIYLLKLHQNGTRIEIDEDFLEDEVEPEAEPEPSYN